MSDGDHLNIPNTVLGRPRSGSQRSRRSRNGSGSGSGLQPPEPADYTRRPSIRIRGFSNYGQSYSGQQADASTSTTTEDASNGGSASAGGVRRNRSLSAPQKVGAAGLGSDNGRPSSRMGAEQMPDVIEEASPHHPDNEKDGDEVEPVPEAEASTSSWRPLRRARTNIAADRDGGSRSGEAGDEYESTLVDFLDTIDPEVQTLQTLTNVQNSLFVPDLGRYLNRRPTYNITRPVDIEEEVGLSDADTVEEPKKEERRETVHRTQTGATLSTLTSRVNDKYYAVLPHGVSLPGWSEEEKLELNDYVRHMMHSRRSKFKRSMRGFGQYVRKPLGFFVTLYATLITLFGLAWVLFLIGWINVGGRKLYITNVIDNILVALFAIVGDGLAPFRAVDTYHMIFIAHYHHLTWRLRKEKALPKLQNRNDLPPLATELEESEVPKVEVSVLTEEQQRKLRHHQAKFAKSHSFYKPHETITHHAFPLRLLVAIVVLLDCHSLLQISLGTCTWAISYHVRPFALTTVILCCSITCNITAGILISVGDHKTRKKDVLEKMERQALTQKAIKKVVKRKERESMDILRESVDISRQDSDLSKTSREDGKSKKNGKAKGVPEIRGQVLESVKDEDIEVGRS